MTFKEKLEDIIKNYKFYLASHGVGGNSIDSTVSQILALIESDIVGESEEESYSGAYNMGKERPENMDIKIKNKLKEQIKEKLK